MDRLISASCASWSHTYSYDKAGNRIAKDGVTYTVNAVNEITALTDGTTFAYDSNGNRTQKTKGSDSWIYTYDYANRLTEVETNSETVGEYVYDGGGKRIRVTENGVTTTYKYAGLNVLYEDNMTGTAAYIYGPTGRLAKRTTIDSESCTFYYHTDHLGSTRLVTNETKTIVVDATYEPFGESAVTGEESNLFTGKEMDTTSLHYYGARYYDPETGGFITRDLLIGRKAIPQSLNRYTYCLSNPVKFVDPHGLAFRTCNVNSGGCQRYYETRSSKNPNQPSWVAYDANGEIITDSNKIEELMNQETHESLLEATYLILLVLGYSEEEHGLRIADDHIELTVNGELVKIYVHLKKNNPVYQKGHTEREDGYIRVDIWIGAFAGANALYHVVGHEMIHVQQHSSGEIEYWESQYNAYVAWALAEYNAIMWNLSQLNNFPLLDAGQDYLDRLHGPVFVFMRTRHCSPWWCLQ